MSVTFYDADNPPVFLDGDYESGIWLNFSNSNGATLLYYMGLNPEDLYGSMEGEEFRRNIHRGIQTVMLLDISQKDYILDKFDHMMETFKNSKTIKWD